MIAATYDLPLHANVQRRLPTDRTVFTLDNVGFSIQGQWLVEGLSLSLDARRVTGLIGHNGIGKSKLVRMLFRHQPMGFVRCDRQDRSGTSHELQKTGRNLHETESGFNAAPPASQARHSGCFARSGRSCYWRPRSA